MDSVVPDLNVITSTRNDTNNRTLNMDRQLERSFQHLERFQYQDALAGFSQVLSLDANNHDARVGYNLAIQRTVHRWHFGMLNDHQRNNAFEAAIQRVVKDKVVLDVGSGSGLLAMMAARAGARKVYTCEMDPNVAECAREIVAANGYDDVIDVIAKKSDALTSVDMREKAHVLVTETLDSALLGEGIVPIVRDARRRLLVERAHIIPQRAEMHFALLDSRSIWNLNHAETASGFDVSLFNRFSSNGFYPVRIQSFEHRLLSEPQVLGRFDFERDALEPRHFDIPLRIVQDGHCHAVVYWFDLYLDAESLFTTEPGNVDSHWRQAIQCFENPHELSHDDRCVLSVRQGLTRFDYSLNRVGR